MKFPSVIDIAVWSPCSRFIAIAWGRFKATIEILDAVTLGQLTILNFPLGELGGTRWLIFSPNAHLLTCFGETPGQFITWDVRTGVLVSATFPDRRRNPQDCLSVTYSACEKIGILFRDDHASTISTYDVRSGTHIYSHSIEGRTLDEIWTHGEYFRFATTKSGSITTWEVGFTSTDTPVEVQSFPIPDDSHRFGHFLLHPTLSRFAFIAGKRVKVWNAQDSKYLLDSTDAKRPKRMSLSIDGRFFACGTSGPEFYLWKESPTGYTLHQKLISNTGTSKPVISPNGESIIAFGASELLLWRTADSTASPSTISTRTSQRSEKSFILRFSPDGTLAAVTRMGDRSVTVLDLKSGIPRPIIDAGTKVYGLGVGGGTIIVVGDGRIITWNLPAGDGALSLGANISDSVRTTIFDHPPFPTLPSRPTTSVSPDLCRVAIVEVLGRTDSCLHLYDVPTGQRLTSVSIGSEASPWFTADGSQVWCVMGSDEADLWGTVEDSESGVAELEQLKSIMHPPDGSPWRPSRGYSVMHDRWVLNSSDRRLLWLPPHWRSVGWDRMWSGRFIVSLDRELPEPVIVELE